MSTKDTGVAAFPRDSIVTTHSGMTLRDYFAAQGMQAMIASMNPDDMADVCEEERIFKEHAADLAKHAYWYADAMIAARNK